MRHRQRRPPGVITLTSAVAGTPIASSATVNTVAQDVTTTTANGFVDYTPDANYNGTDTFTYQVSNNLGVNSSFDTGKVTVTITPENDAPVIKNDFATAISEVATASVNVLANDSDIDGDDLTVTGLGNLKITVATADVGNYATADTATDNGNGTTTLQYAPDSGPTGDGTTTQTTVYPIGTVVFNDDPSNANYGTVKFTPVAGAFQSLGAGEKQDVVFDYTASDGTVSATKTVTISITGTNDAPVASAASVTTTEDQEVSGTLSAVDPDDATGDLKFFIAAGGQPANGRVVIGPHDTIALSERLLRAM